MSSGTYAPYAVAQFLDTNGNPLASGSLYTYLAGTSTPATTYSDVALSVANANPIPLNAAGRPSAGASEVGIFLTPGASYKFVVKDSGGSTIATRDNIAAIPTSSSSLDVTGTAGEALTAGQAVYLSDGSGSKTAGSYYKADSANTYSSTTGKVGMVPASIASGASGTIRLSGSVTGLSSLVVGSTYYVGTAGAITSTPPTNARVLGVADTTSSLVLVTAPSTTDLSAAALLTAANLLTGVNTFSAANIFSSGNNSFKAGTSTESLVPMGLINVDSTSTGTGANTTDTTALSYSLPANAFDATGRALCVIAYGTFAANGNSKTIRLKWNGTSGTSFPAVTTTSNNAHWCLIGFVIRTGSSTQNLIGFVSMSGGAQDMNTTFATATATDTGAITLAVTMQNGTASANDIVYKGSLILYLG